jgi:MoxR-like ATPase
VTITDRITPDARKPVTPTPIRREEATMHSITTKPSPEEMVWAKNKLNQVLSALNEVIIAQPELTKLLVCALAIGQRAVLLEGPPGLAKTIATKALAALVDGDVGRVQGTHDLLASDITGYMVPAQSATGQFAGLELHQGPIFKAVFYADDISRASEKALSGLIEALEEGWATIDGVTYPLPRAQVCISNMNPVEFVGTNQVPEAILDRHAGSADVSYPSEDAEVQIARMNFRSINDLAPVITESEILRLRNIVARIQRTASEAIARKAVLLVRGTANTDVFVHRASPRASQDTILLASVSAALRGSNELNEEDLRQGALFAIPHRVEFTPEFAADNPNLTVRQWIAEQSI